MRVKVLSRALAFAAMASLLVLACNLDGDYYGGGGSFGGSSGIGSSGTSGTSGSGLPPPGACATAKEGESCSNFGGGSGGGTRCEQKTHANITCNVILDCDPYTYVWTATSLNEQDDDEDEDADDAGDAGDADDGGDAGDAGRTNTACATECPAAYTLTPPDGTCTVPKAGTLICEYPEGTCGCAPVRRTASDGGDAGDDGDAGDAGPTEYVWKCVQPAAGCPRTRPANWDDCVRPMTCDYGDCVFTDGVKMRCYGQAWQSSKTPEDQCP